MIIDLTGKSAIVTGGAHGIGRSVAEKLAEKGASVIIADIDESSGSDVADELFSAGYRVRYVHCDVSSETDIQNVIETCLSCFGRLDILVNNAHSSVNGTAEVLSSEDWDRDFAVLLKAHYLATKYAVEAMRQQGGGNIINISSILGKFSVPNRLTYTTAKAAVTQLTRQMALDHAPDGIRVNTITPGTIIRNNERKLCDSTSVPIGAYGIPYDIAHAICFLVSDYATHITGAELVIDGGQSLPFHRDIVREARAKFKTSES